MTIRETFPTMRHGWTTGPYLRYSDHPVGRIIVESSRITVKFRNVFPMGTDADRMHFKYPRFSIFIAREMEA